MANRNVKRLLYSAETDMGGMPIRQALPTKLVEQIDPFLLLHHHLGSIAPYSSPKSIGVGPHPHRGFSPVTFILQGDVHHRDSRGNNSVVGEGGVQWMNAGMGIVHGERPSAELAHHGGVQELIQLWINTPSTHKMAQPEYFALPKESIPHYITEDGRTKVSVVAGHYQNLKGSIVGKSPLMIYRIDLQEGGIFRGNIPANYNLAVYNIDGNIKVSGFGLVEGLNLIHFDRDGDDLELVALENTRLLLLAGIPIDEPVVSHGPFVMNTQSQIMQAMRDAQMGKMGILIE